MDIDASAHTGAWINWSKGSVFGATLTLSNRNASILISTITIFIQISGTWSWMIFCYLLHQWKTKQGAYDGLYHQHQALLRNGGSDLSVLWQLANVASSWHRLLPRVKRRSLILAITCLVHLAIFSGLGIFTSTLTQLGNETLVDGANCGLWDPLSNAIFGQNISFSQAYDIDVTHNLAVSQRQVQSCTGGAAVADDQCNVFRSNITHNEKSVPCPFADPSMCMTADGQAFQLDTGAMDSHDDLGINAPVNDRVAYRQLATCSPVKLDGYIIGPLNKSMPGDPTGNPPGIQYEYWNYGPTGTSNYTYEVTNWRDYFPAVDPQQAPPYQLDLITSYESDNFYKPISNLSIDSADFEMLFLQNTVWYGGPVDDPWFSAHKESNLTTPSSGDGDNITIPNLYRPDNDAVALGCAVQFQLCNGGKGSNRCSELSGVDDLRDNVIPNNTLGLNDPQLTAAMRLINNTNQAALAPVVRAFGAQVLLANEATGSGFTSNALPDNQWQLELANMYRIMITAFQRSVLEYASGPQPDIRALTARPASNTEQSQCHSQVLRRNDFTNFSILALAIICAIGVLLALSTILLEPLLNRIQSRSANGQFRNLRWEKDSVLELQRMAYQANGLGNWRPGGDGVGRQAVPVTEAYERFTFPESKTRKESRGFDTPTEYVREVPKNVQDYQYRQLPAPPRGFDGGKGKRWWRR